MIKRATLVLVILTALVTAQCEDVTGGSTASNDAHTQAAILALATSAGNGSNGGGTGNSNILSTTPSNGAVLTAATSTVVVNFAEAVNTSSVQSAFSVSDGAGGITGTFAWSNGNKTLTFTPGALTAYKSHTVTISTAQTAAGGTIQSYTFTFRIGPFFTTTGTGSLYWQSGVSSNGDYPTASSYCSGLGLRLATLTEWTNAYPGNAGSLFNPGGAIYYWTSTVALPSHTAVTGNGGTFSSTAGGSDANVAYIRCVI